MRRTITICLEDTDAGHADAHEHIANAVWMLLRATGLEYSVQLGRPRRRRQGRPHLGRVQQRLLEGWWKTRNVAACSGRDAAITVRRRLATVHSTSASQHATSRPAPYGYGGQPMRWLLRGCSAVALPGPLKVNIGTDHAVSDRVQNQYSVLTCTNAASRPGAPALSRPTGTL